MNFILRCLRRRLLAIPLLCCLNGVVYSQPVVSGCTDYCEAVGATKNPDRGWFRQIRTRGDFRIDWKSFHDESVRVYFEIGRYQTEDIDDEALESLRLSLTRAKDRKIRIIARFTYDWPTAEFLKHGLSGRQAQTPAAEQMLRHVYQLGSLLKEYETTISHIESGMIGFWGEQHGDTVEKQDTQFMLKIVNSWFSALAPSQIPILIRYPKAFRAYTSNSARSSMSNAPNRLGMWNDCLAAIDDVLVENPTSDLKLEQRPILGETCALPPKTSYGCTEMTEYFKSIYLDMLHRDYYAPTLKMWADDGCFEHVSTNLGYRYVIRGSRWADNFRRLIVRVDNVGWGKSVRPRRVILNVDGLRQTTSFDSMDWLPASENILEIVLDHPISKGSVVQLEIAGDVRFSNTTGGIISNEITAGSLK